mmetsp:Transcript_113876/g.317060  ORF Transcript_113876/g.317060 Transcript_113876/m.317060 type:complete len:205 (-) Transcript_113876:185-799(-)|eukprot:CAMPEP_0179076086 /NCGR_PEP_ID=MMETSP0796-20121207/33921_1 /TAXON_ID=73915 /ORGANISM="Pyrodinium bahamense, Strain pbaha01" /LENGTH=204 /DNA_ID=CAMNT_0020773331 /DNA_START=124 /DNA_END=738 /DNA_ORIENTATION=+
MSQRASGILAIPPSSYGQPKGAFWKGLGELERYPPTYPDREDLFDEYMSNKSMQQSRHVRSLSQSRGLLELHYDTMRKKQMERASRPTYIHGPTMDRPFAATTGYSGFIPGKDSGNICGCTFANGSRLAHDTRGKYYDAPMSGVTFTLGSKGSFSKSQSLPQLSPQRAGPGLGATMPGSSRRDSAPRSPFKARDLKSMMPGEFD